MDKETEAGLMTENVKENTPIIRIKELEKYFLAKRGYIHMSQYVKAVDGISLDVMEGETVGLVGESGCGKSTLGRTIMKIYEPTGGEIFYRGQNITKLSNKKMHNLRKSMQMIFQDPYASLNPRFTIGDIIEEPMVIHNMYTKAERKEKVYELLELVGLKPDHIRRYPHEFSGGQRQRVGIARTLALNPDFIVCDEPISALDVSIQAQIINLLEKIQDEQGISYLFIAHDLGMVKHISHKIGVMYLGHLVEFGDADEVYNHPLHPYTEALMSAAPIPDPKLARESKRIMLKGEIPSPLDMPTAAAFDDEEQLILFLPVKGVEGYKVVNEELLKNKDTLEFIKSIGVKQPSLKDQIYNIILPQYTNEADIDTNPHFMIFFNYYCKCSNEEIEEFIDLIKAYDFLTFYEDGVAYRGRASEMYMPTDELVRYFESKPSTRFIDLDSYKSMVGREREKYLISFLTELGVKSSPSVYTEKQAVLLHQGVRDAEKNVSQDRQSW